MHQCSIGVLERRTGIVSGHQQYKASQKIELREALNGMMKEPASDDHGYATKEFVSSFILKPINPSAGRGSI